MSQQPKIPGPDHPITIKPSGKTVKVSWNGHVVAETRKALDLAEASYPVVHYIPREDVDMKLLARTDRSTHCPYKGDASYFSLVSDRDRAENAIWSYETPFPAVSEIAGHVAFYPDKVKIETF